MSLEIRYLRGKVNYCKTRSWSCFAVFLDLSLWTSRTKQVLLVLRSYHPNKTDKIDRLIYASSSKIVVKMSNFVKQLLYVLKLFQVTVGCIHSFRIRSKETLRIMYPKYPVFDKIQRIHLRCGSFGSIIRFWILVKKRNIRFRIKNPNLDFSKETHPHKFTCKLQTKFYENVPSVF